MQAQMIEVDVIKEAYGSREANQLLDQGWKLLAVIAAIGPQQPGLMPCYVFGMKK